MSTIAEIYSFEVKPYTNSRAVPKPCPDPTLLYGLELEIEGVSGEPTDWYVGGMYGDADNSLRSTNRGVGWEYITKPATFSIVNLILTNFFNKTKFTADNYSERCSVHVHCNVQDMTPTQVQSVCLLYQAFEGLLYQFAGEDRDKNIFCVPWAQTQITYQLLNSLEAGKTPDLRNWQKYTGLNLIPIATQGTIEFRHLPGTCDLDHIMNWLTLIGCLFRTAKTLPLDRIEGVLTKVNTNSEYRGLLDVVFGEWAHLVESEHYVSLIESGIIDVKYLLMGKSEVKKKFSYSYNELERMVSAMNQAQPVLQTRRRPVPEPHPWDHETAVRVEPTSF